MPDHVTVMQLARITHNLLVIEYWDAHEGGTWWIISDPKCTGAYSPCNERWTGQIARHPTTSYALGRIFIMEFPKSNTPMFLQST
jgi:hypothetical protein